MSHYHLEIIISKEEVEVIKKEFHQFIEDAGGFTFIVTPDNDVEPSVELEDTIRNIFFNILMTINTGQFKGVN